MSRSEGTHILLLLVLKWRCPLEVTCVSMNVCGSIMLMLFQLSDEVQLLSASYRVAQNKWHIFCERLNFIKY